MQRFLFGHGMADQTLQIFKKALHLAGIGSDSEFQGFIGQARQFGKIYFRVFVVFYELLDVHSIESGCNFIST